ncbi:MAG: RNA ligase [Methanobacterium sp.]|nr:RNA ligase [Methanobacterium sp.]
MPDFIIKILPKMLDLKSENLERSFKNGNIKFYSGQGVEGLQFRKDVGHIESGTMICFGSKIEIVRGFPKIRRTLLLNPSLMKHFKTEVAVEEKMNGYNVRLALVNQKIKAFTRGGYICPYTTKKAPEILDMENFFDDNPELVICGEMVGTENPYVTHHYREIGKLGFRIFDLRYKTTNQPLTIKEKYQLLNSYNLPAVKSYGIIPIEEAVERIFGIIEEMDLEDREGVVIKDPEMVIEPVKYTSSRAHLGEIEYAFNYPFDFGRSFFFSRVIREGFQAFELGESEEEIRKRAHLLGESILFPMVNTIKHVSEDNSAYEDIVIHVENNNEAEEFARHLRDLGVVAIVQSFNNGKAVIRRIHQSTTDRISNYIRGGLY